jgi:myo-inositol-1(or 4)-monophosphatase
LPERDLALLEAAAREAGELALRHFAGPRTPREKPGGHGPVTEADLEVDRLLRDRLTAARPAYGWLSEESEDGPARLAAERVFIVDPIDGTREFVAGGRSWGPALAVAERGRVIAAVMYLPALERTYAAALGQGARMNGVPIAAGRRAVLEGARVLATRGQMRPELWPAGVPEVEHSSQPALAYRLCLVAEGRFDAALTCRDAWEWDVAAGALIATEAGGVVSDRHGAAPVFNSARARVPGLLVAGATLHGLLLDRMLVGGPV